MACSKLKYLRERIGKTQQEFADELGVTRSAISNYEIGRREPDGAFFAKLKEKYKISEKAIGEMLLEIAEKRNVNSND